MSERELDHTRPDPEQLLQDYIEVCNLAIAENRDRYWYRKAIRLNRAVLGEADFRTVVYEDDPSEPIAEFVLHFDPEQPQLEVQDDEGQDTVFTWKVSTAYLQDVLERPEWYLAEPIRLDWAWMKHRASDQVERIDGPSFGAGFIAGALAVGLAVWVTASGRD